MRLLNSRRGNFEKFPERSSNWNVLAWGVFRSQPERRESRLQQRRDKTLNVIAVRCPGTIEIARELVRRIGIRSKHD